MLLSSIVIVPFITALAVICVSDNKWELRRWISLIGCGIIVILAGVITYEYWQAMMQDANPSKVLSNYYLGVTYTWFKSYGIEYNIGVDGIAVAMIDLTAIIIFTGILASWQVKNRSKEFFALLLILVTGVFGVFISVDIFLFFVFYEVAVLPMYLLIGVWGTGKKEYAAMKLTMMLMVGSAFLLVGILAIYNLTGGTTFDMNKIAAVAISKENQYWLFPIIFIGFGILGALFPFHTWSPDGHASAPTAVSMLHAGVLMKLGGYGVLRVAIYLLPDGAKDWALFFLILTTINVVYGAYAAVKQKDLKYFTAYSSVSHCGFVLFGVCTLNIMGFKGAVIQMVSHGLMTGLFFGLIGMVYGRTHTRNMDEMGGLASKMPWLATCFYIGGLASLGLPGLSGFVAESHVFLGGMFANNFTTTTATFITRICTVLAVSSIVVTAVYVLRGLSNVFQGEITNQKFETLTDANMQEKICTAILVFSLAFVGMFPQPLIRLIESSLLPFIERL